MKQEITFICIGLVISLALAFFLSPIASSFPDGLEKVAEKIGFSKSGEAKIAWVKYPVPDYLIPGLANEKISSAVAGVVGTLAVFLLGSGLGKILKARPRKGYGTGKKAKGERQKDK